MECFYFKALTIQLVRYFMSMNPDTKSSGCCGGSKKVASHDAQKPATQTTTDAKTKESVISPPQKPTTPQPKPKSCCE
jgi:hypothetical protein